MVDQVGVLVYPFSSGIPDVADHSMFDREPGKAVVIDFGRIRACVLEIQH
jgi:hypothetical protein